jgi:DNA-binding NtrC family response regulator
MPHRVEHAGGMASPPRAATGGTPLRALVVDDDPLIGRAVDKWLTALGLEVVQARNGREALARFDSEPINLVVADLVMPGMGGRELFEEVRRRNSAVPVVLITAFGELDEAVTLMRAGAADFIQKPLEERTFVPRIERVLHTLRLEQEVKQLRVLVGGKRQLAHIVGEAPAIRKVLMRLPSIAESGAPVLIYGESGTGKELAARAIHYLSPRKDEPFIVVNCGALPEELLESELFGHVRGAFTDARTDKLGLAEAADGGTLFLDEIGEIPGSVQVKLLRFLQEKEVKPVGATRTITVDVRIVAATNRDLAREIKAGRFREDLYYRLNVLPVRMPALRERRDDVPLLADLLLKRFTAEAGKAIVGLSPAAVQKLVGHGWPGNVRELENVLRRAVVLSLHQVIEPSDILLGEFGEEDAPERLSFQDAKARVVSEFERGYLVAVLAAHAGNVTRAAEAAGKDRKSFWELLKKHGIDARRFRPEGSAAGGGAADAEDDADAGDGRGGGGEGAPPGGDGGRHGDGGAAS